MTASPRKILVTGASRGIGAAVVDALLERGHRVTGWARSFGADSPARAGFAARAVDLGDLARLEPWLADARDELADVDAAVLNAGRGELGHLEQFSCAQIRALIDLDFTSHAYVARALLPSMKRRGRGDLIFIGSEAGLQGKRQGSVYCAAKFALRGFAQALRDECATSGVRVSIIEPGIVRTAFFDTLDIEPADDPASFLVPEDIASVVLAILDSRPEMVWDEVIVSPLKRVIQTKVEKRGKRKEQ